MKATLTSILVTILLLEIFLRVLGFGPSKPNQYLIESQPDFFLAPDSLYGYRLNEGEYNVTINKGVTFNTSQQLTDRRLIRNDSTADKSIFIYGCSFTYGLGVNADQSWPSVLSKQLNGNYLIQNFAIPGYGNIQSLQRIQEIKRSEILSGLHIIAYSEQLHSPRDNMTRLQRKLWSEAFQTKDSDAQEILQSAKFPFVKELAENEEIVIQYWPMADLYQPWIGSKFSAIINLAESASMSTANAKSGNNEVSRTIIYEIKELLDQQGDSKLLVLGITNDANTAEALEEFQGNGLHAVNVSLNLSLPENNLMPYDGHPSVKAHQHYAAECLQYIESQNLLEF